LLDLVTLSIGRRQLIFVFGGLAVMAIALLIWIGWPKTDKPGVPPSPSPTPSASGPALSPPDFETVTLDSQGKEMDRRRLQAEYFTEDLDGVPLEMVKVPGGTFEMGSPNNDPQLHYCEVPQHSVTVPEFFMGRFEVTREQWRQVARMPKVKIDLKEDPAYFRDSLKQPVEQVRWVEAVEFCERLKKKTRKPYRLPSEAEWEYAARAGTETLFAFGPTITPKIVNYDGNPSIAPPNGTDRQKTVEVGSLGVANAFGLYDMHGNVWEWCEDVWHQIYGGEHGNPPVDGSAWVTGGEQDRRVLRGGSWHAFIWNCHSTKRDHTYASSYSNDCGFRVVVAARRERNPARSR
jgi:formylglycine-generating enzyme required for sulfatase activity